MNRTFYQFLVSEQHGEAISAHRAAIVSAGDEEEAREFFHAKDANGNPLYYELGAKVVAFHAQVERLLPEAIGIERIDSGAMRTCWSSWRVTDFVYGLGDGQTRASADGVIMAHDQVPGDFSGFNVRLAVLRALTVNDMGAEELVALCQRAGMALSRWRVFWALRWLLAHGHVHLAPDTLLYKPLARVWERK